MLPGSNLVRMSEPTVPAVLARIRERDVSRQAALQTRVEASVQCKELQRQCADLEQDVRAAVAAAERALKELRTPDLEAAAALLSSYEKAVAGACSHVAMYEAQQLHAHVKGLREQLLQLRAQGAPKKRFSFVRKPAAAQTISGELKEPNSSASGSRACLEDSSEAQRPRSNAQDNASGLRSSIQLSEGVPAENSRSSAASCAVALSADSTRCFSGKVHETIQHTLEGEGGPMVIRDLSFCTVCVRGRIEALRMHGLRDCTVIAGPVHGSAFVEGVERSMLIIECNQARIHRSTDSTFLLRVISNPVIEHSTRLRFGPFPGAEQHSRSNSMWRQVQDFGWLRSTPSPNWTVVGDEFALSPEVKGMLDIV